MSLRRPLEEIARRARPMSPVDPTRFNDALALRTEWTPLRPGGAGFRTHRLRADVPGRLEFRPLAPWRLLLFGAAIVPLVLVAGDVVGVVLAILVALVVGGTVLFLRPAVFDRASGQYWVGWRPPSQGAAPGKAGRLNDVYALQLIGERIRRKNGAFTSYELNLVLRGGARCNVVDHDDLAALREDARQLARFLSCRLWDATDAPAAGGAPVVPTAPPAPTRPSPPTALPPQPGLNPLRVLLGALGQVLGTIFVLALLAFVALLYLVTQEPETFRALVQWVFEQVAAADTGA